MRKLLTWHDWRWLWLWQLVRAAVVLTLIVPMLALYPLSVAIVGAFNAVGNWQGSLYVRWHNRDLARKQGLARRPGEARPDGWLP